MKVADWRKGKKRIRTPGGETKIIAPKKKHSKRTCALCREVMHGVLHGKKSSEVRAASKSSRRPSAVFGGVLCGACREEVVEEAAKVEGKFKEIDEVPFKMKTYVEGIMKRVSA